MSLVFEYDSEETEEEDDEEALESKNEGAMMMVEALACGKSKLMQALRKR
jgi:hypothetical protein